MRELSAYEMVVQRRASDRKRGRHVSPLTNPAFSPPEESYPDTEFGPIRAEGHSFLTPPDLATSVADYLSDMEDDDDMLSPRQTLSVLEPLDDSELHNGSFMSDNPVRVHPVALNFLTNRWRGQNIWDTADFQAVAASAHTRSEWLEVEIERSSAKLNPSPDPVTDTTYVIVPSILIDVGGIDTKTVDRTVYNLEIAHAITASETVDYNFELQPTDTNFSVMYTGTREVNTRATFAGILIGAKVGAAIGTSLRVRVNNVSPGTVLTVSVPGADNAQFRDMLDGLARYASS